MGKLDKNALYSNENLSIHYVRACKRGEIPEDINDYERIFDRAIERAKILNPNGEKSFSLLKNLQAQDI